MTRDVPLTARLRPLRDGTPIRSGSVFLDGISVVFIARRDCISTEQGSFIRVSTTADVWQPTSVRRVIRVLDTSTRPIECVLDDGAHAFVKVMGNPEGPSALACELGAGLQ